MSSPRHGAGGRVSPEQLRYARVLDVCMKAALAFLAATFAVYLFGVLPPQVPLEALPRLWALPVADYLSATAAEPGWYWLTRLTHGDALALGAIAVVAGASFPCLALLAVDYARRRDWAYLGITVSLIVLLGLAASGVVRTH
jgi:hypothetical protein